MQTIDKPTIARIQAQKRRNSGAFSLAGLLNGRENGSA
jgi:hypothetical protein